ncbi:hypothetical protein C3Z06_09625 [Cupriavidus metallidurans]|nr:hypothetical protein C3Z06_09625 [Cupriavidus metallidurans]
MFAFTEIVPAWIDSADLHQVLQWNVISQVPVHGVREQPVDELVLRVRVALPLPSAPVQL